MKTFPTHCEHYGLTLFVTNMGRRLENIAASTTIAEIGRHISFDPSALDTYHYDGWKPVHHDLLVICAAVEFADRRCARRIGRWSRRFNITVPVEDPEAWQEPGVQMRLRDALRQLTGDEWHFTFVRGDGFAVNGGFQRRLPFESNKQFAIAYSNGLDSRCVSGLYEKNGAAIRVRLTKTRDRVKKGERAFDLIPFRVDPEPSPESSVRSRGFKFAAITAIAAHISGLERIIVPESGQGALGPVLLRLHNIYPDYRNHPVFLQKMERFVKALLGHSVSYHQPRIWNTKGQTISAFLAEPGNARDSILDTRSCWQQRWNARTGGKLRQCGLCAACLLRRMSMHAAGIDEPNESYAIADLAAARYADALPKSNRLRLSGTMVDYASVGARHLAHLAEMAELPDARLRRDAYEIARATNAHELDVLANLRQLLVHHREEWQAFLSAQGKKSFINRWIEGGRHCGSE